MSEQGWAFTFLVDDILVLGERRAEVEEKAAKLVPLLTKSGVHANGKESMPAAA